MSSTVTRRRHRWVGGALLCLLLLALTANEVDAHPGAVPVSPDPTPRTRGTDQITDQFLQRFRTLRADPARRQALANGVTTAATQHRLDPDLLLALVAVESGFNRTAVSPKGARGLGQLMFGTARAVAPAVVRHPSDLYDVRRNLAVTAEYLHDLLIAADGNLRAALTAYHRGVRERRPLRRKQDGPYVGLVCTIYASLKVKRRDEDMVAATPGAPRTWPG
jgi:soluble lytic murein transglycosylase-like protein